jgi:PEP-CTERM motif-containing protein
MKTSTQWLSSSIVAVVIILLSSTRPAFGDTYTIYDLGNDNGHGIYGIDSAGDVVIWGSSGCGISSPICYVTYVDGVATEDTSTAPVLAYDDGTFCGSTPAGFNASKSVCNDGWIGLGSLFSPNGDPNGVYIGSGSNFSFLGRGSADQLFLNSAGDLAWADGQDEEMYVAILNTPPKFDAFDFSVQEDPDPVATPEPASWLLLGTGLLGFAAAIRRKANR